MNISDGLGRVEMKDTSREDKTRLFKLENLRDSHMILKLSVGDFPRSSQRSETLPCSPEVVLRSEQRCCKTVALLRPVGPGGLSLPSAFLKGLRCELWSVATP